MDRIAITGLALIVVAGHASGQFPEIEPNSGKSEATIIGPIVTGSFYTGTSTGNGTILGDPSLPTADYFRLDTQIGPTGIYCYEDIKSSPTPGHTFSIRGVNQLGGVPGTNDVAVQLVSPVTTPSDRNKWYGKCAGDKHYSRTDGTASTNGGHRADVVCTPVSPYPIPGAFLPGPITVTTIGQGHLTDTEIYLFDANVTPIAGGHNDDSIVPASVQSFLTLPLPVGTYIVAVSDYNTCNNISDQNPNEAFLDGNLLDFPDCLTNSRTTTNVNIAFSVSDGTTTSLIPAVKVNAFDIFFARFHVGSLGVGFCFGDGSGAGCPCGNFGAIGNGCANSILPSGARLVAAGTASVSADTVVLSGSGMPNSFVLYFQGLTQLNGGMGVPFGDGLRCAGGTITRLATKLNVSNASSYPSSGDPPLSVKGAIPPGGGTRTYQGWYRDAMTFCTPFTFNLTNGVQFTWTP